MLQSRLLPCVHILKGMLLQGNPQLLIYPQPLTCDLHQQLCAINNLLDYAGYITDTYTYAAMWPKGGALGAVFLSNKKKSTLCLQLPSEVPPDVFFTEIDWQRKYAIPECQVWRLQILKDRLKNPVRENLSVAQKPAASESQIVENDWKI